jgi:hypothetical protein
MKQKLIIMLLVVGFGLGGCAINTPPHIANYYPSIVTLKNGTILEGKTKGTMEYSFYFMDNNNKKTKYFNTDVEKVKKQFLDHTAEYVTVDCVTTTSAKKPYNMLGVKEVEGELSLYSREIILTSSHTNNFNGGSVASSFRDYLTTYYFKKRNEPAFEILHFSWIYYEKPLNKKFIEFAKEYFNDQPNLASKIGKVGYELKDIKKIVEEYNQLKNQ